MKRGGKGECHSNVYWTDIGYAASGSCIGEVDMAHTFMSK